MARRNPKPRDSKERILAAALALFGERGYGNTSIDEIAARADLTKGALYYYFADKGISRAICTTRSGRVSRPRRCASSTRRPARSRTCVAPSMRISRLYRTCRRPASFFASSGPYQRSVSRGAPSTRRRSASFRNSSRRGSTVLKSRRSTQACSRTCWLAHSPRQRCTS